MKLCWELGLSDATTEDIQKDEIKEAIQLNNTSQLKSDMAGKTKLEEFCREDVRRAQDYVGWSVEECRMGFRLQTRMFDSRANMPCRYTRDLWQGLGPMTQSARARVKSWRSKEQEEQGAEQV